MSRIPFGILISHAPGLTVRPELVDEARWQILNPAFAAVRELLESTKPDLILAFINDHFQNFFLDGMPAFCLGIGEEHQIPSSENARYLRIPSRTFKGAPKLARNLLAQAMEAGFDPAFSEEITFLDELAVPFKFLFPYDSHIPVIPIIINCVAPPLPGLRRCYNLGRALGDALAKTAPEKVIVIGSGGISHWVGTPETGRVNEKFDHEVLELIRTCRVDELLSWSDDQISREGGNGAYELRNWIGALGAMGSYRTKFASYVSAPEWIAGIGVVALEPA